MANLHRKPGLAPLASLVWLLTFAALLSTAAAGRERIRINADWRFSRFTSAPDSLSIATLKPWLLPSMNDFISGTKKQRPSGTAPAPTQAQASFNDGSWEKLNLPHDWAIKGPFNAPGVSGGMGRLPSNGIGWYRRTVEFTADDTKRSVFLDVDGAMSFASVWLNGQFVGGWGYGYTSFRLDLTPFVKAGENNLAIRVENPNSNSRWYPGAGIYRNVWIVKVDPVHVSKYGTYVTTPSVSSSSAKVNLVVEVENKGTGSQQVSVSTDIKAMDPASGSATGGSLATIAASTATIAAGGKGKVTGSTTVNNPLLWGPSPQKPNMYVAVTTVSVGGQAVDTYETPFGIRTVTYDANKGVSVNGQAVRIQGTCNHHDLGSLGSAINNRAIERQLEMLQEMGGNALRTSHNPQSPEFMDYADKMGFMVMDEWVDVWASKKTTNDYAGIGLWADWHEADLRTLVRRDRNHPSVIAWSIGNEISEQSGASGGTIGTELRNTIRDEDNTRPVTAGLNNANANAALSSVLDIPGLNYQGEGRGTSTSSSWPSFHDKFPNKMLWTTESSSVLSSRGTYIFPVTSGNSATVGGASAGGDPSGLRVSAYDLYEPGWGSSPDKVFQMQDKYPYVAGEFVWTGWDYIGEPTPYDTARSSYFGIIDLAGFKKDRFYLYQSRWRPDLAQAHILPHWTWPDRVGQVTPVHVFTSGDEAELFVNGVSAGRKKKTSGTYRLRWDDVKYQAGDLRVVAYKGGKEWATATQRTAGAAAALNGTADRTSIAGDGVDLSFVSVAVQDKDGILVPKAANSITFSVSGPGQIVSTDNGDPADMTAFPSTTRKAFSGRALAIVRATGSGQITVSAKADGLTTAQIVVQAR